MDVEISIIVPVYNVELYIEKCIKSILNQTYQKFELLLINDGTKDNSLEICRRYRYDNRVRIISQPNKGLSGARNTGIRVARGKYLLFVDSDDYIAPEMLADLYNEMIIEDADIVQCSFTWVMGNNKLKKAWYRGCALKKIIYDDEWFEEYENNFLLFTVAWNKLYKKSLFDKIKYPIGKTNEDEYVLFPLLCATQKIVILNRALYYYVQRDSSLSSVARIDTLIENYLDYSGQRLKILWNRKRELFGKYLYMHYQGLMYYDNVIREKHLDYKWSIVMKKQSIQYLGDLFKYSDVNLRDKINILKWNLKLK